MRIRRLSSRILGTSAVPPSPPPPPPALLPSSAGQVQAALVCVLNQSPWDALPWPLTPPSRSELPPLIPKVEEEVVNVANGTRSDEESKTTPIICSLPAANSEMYRGMAKKKGTPPLSMKKKMKKGKIRVKEESGIVATCNKTDGKQWKCKQPVSHPHSLCSYHRTQLRSYAKVGGGNPKKAPKAQMKKKASVRASTAAGSDSSSFYYYSTFGPWRGKRRCGGNGGGESTTAKVAVKEVDEEMESDDDDENNVTGQAIEVAGQIDVEDDDRVDADRAVEERSPHKRRRKPVKARSLKSLL